VERHLRRCEASLIQWFMHSGCTDFIPANIEEV